MGSAVTYEASGSATQYNAPYGQITVHHHHGRVPAAALRPWMAPPMTDGMVNRPELSQQLLDLVCRDGAGPVAVAGVHGAGGFGKSTLAAWLCHQPPVRQRFPGGLLWVTVGERIADAELASTVNDLAEQLTGDRPAFADPMQAGFRLGDLLDDRLDPVLMVIDDVWSEAQVAPFLCGGQRCRRVVTTRNRWLVPASADTVTVDRMTPAQAARLLTRDVPGGSSGLVDQLLTATGRWPVLLGLANRAIVKAVGYGSSVDGALRRILDRLADAGPTAFDVDNRHHRGRAVAATVRAGLDLVDPATAERFTELAIFAEDTDIPFAVLELLWREAGLSSQDVRRMCEELADLSLVQGYRPEPGSVRIHDVIRGYLMHTAGAERLTAVHGRLLREAGHVVRSAWWDLPDGYDYLVAHLCEHLTAAGRQDEVSALVTDLRWVETRLRRHGPAGVEADLARTDGPLAAALMKAIRQAGHLLGPLDPPAALGAVLASRLDGIAELAVARARHVATFTGPRLVNRWSLPDQPHPALLRTLVGNVRRLVVGPDGSWLVGGTGYGHARSWDPRTGAALHVVSEDLGPVRVIAAVRDGVLLAPGTEDVRLSGNDPRPRTDLVGWIWDPVTGGIRCTLAGFDEYLHEGAVAEHGTWFATVTSIRRLGVVSIWDQDSGERQWRVEPGSSTDTVIADPRGEWLAIVDLDGGIRLWDVAAGAWRHEFAVPGASQFEAAPDGSSLVVGRTDGTVQIWDVTTGRCRHTLAGRGRDTVDLIACAPDGTWIAGANDYRGGGVDVWDAGAGSLRHTLPAFPQRPSPQAWWATRLAVTTRVMCALPDSGWLATAGEGPTTTVWDTIRGERRNTLTGHAEVQDIVAAPDGAWMATTTDDYSVRIWHPATTGAPDARRGHTRPVTGIGAAPGADWVATASLDGTLCVWDAATGERRHRLSHPGNGVIGAVAAHPNGAWIATSGQGGVRVWDPASGECLRTLDTGAAEHIQLRISPDGTWIALAPRNGRTVGIWTVATDSCRWLTVERPTDAKRPADIDWTGEEARWWHDPDRLVVGADGSWIAVVHDGVIEIVDIHSGDSRHRIAAHARHVCALVAPDGRWIAAARSDGAVRIWDTGTGDYRSIAADHAATDTGMAMASDGEWFATLGYDGTIRIWDPTTGALRQTLAGRTRGISALVATPGGRLLASTGPVNEVQIWDVVTGTAVAAMRIDAPLGTCAWLSDGSGLCITSDSGTVYLFDFHAGSDAHTVSVVR
jgi:WD40 repeat protein